MKLSIFTSVLLTLIMSIPTQAQPNETHANDLHADLALWTAAAYKAREVHGAVEMRVLGQGAQRVYLFVPAQPKLQDSVPLVVFNHGWQGMNPMNFGALIDHVVRSGHAVIYPVFQDNDSTPPAQLTNNAARATRQALEVLRQDFGLMPHPGQTLYYGFSMGCAISINMALNASGYDLPAPDALMLVAPGDAYHVANGRWPESIYGKVEWLPATLPVVVMAGADDDIGLPTARKIAARLCHVPRDRRILLVVPSSEYGGRKVAAGHGSPGAPDSRYNFTLKQQDFPQILRGRASYEASASLNNLDFYGYWKLMDGLLEGLKSGVYPQVVFGPGTPAQLSLGVWDDGTALNPMVIEGACP